MTGAKKAKLITSLCEKTEKLTEDGLRTMFGTEYMDVVCYNLDTEKFNKHYNKGLHIRDLDSVEQQCHDLKILFGQHFRFKNYELVGVVTKIVAGSDQKKALPRLLVARTVTGAIIVRNRQTGKIESVQDKFVNDVRYDSLSDARQYGMLHFTTKAVLSSSFRDALIGRYTNTKQK